MAAHKRQDGPGHGNTNQRGRHEKHRGGAHIATRDPGDRHRGNLRGRHAHRQDPIAQHTGDEQAAEDKELPLAARPRW